MAKKFKRYLPTSAQRDGPGKGDYRREAQVDPAIEGKKWCETFGHRFIRQDNECINCRQLIERTAD